MNKIILTRILVLFLTAITSLSAQQKDITLEEIWGGAFRTKGMDELNAMKNTNQYTVLNFDRASKSFQIDLYDFATLEKVSTLIPIPVTSANKKLPFICSQAVFNPSFFIIFHICPC